MNQKQIYTEYWKILDDFEDYMNDRFRRERLNTPEFDIKRKNSVSFDSRQCCACNLHHESIRSPISGEGKKKLLIINRALPVSLAEKQTQFSMEEDGFISKWLEAIGLNIERDCKVVPVVLCPVLNREDVSIEHIKSCTPFFDRIIEETDPKAILVLGKEREGYFREKLEKGTSPGKRPFYICHHPSDVLVDLSLKRPVWEVLKQIKDVLVGE